MAYLWFKAFHLIGVVVWFAGLFYLVRLFVYHAEASEKPEPAQSILKEQYEIMEKRLYHIITTPGMIVTVAMAIALISTEPEILKSGWLHIKLGFVLLLIGYHHYCKRLMKKLAAGECQWTGQQFRALNEAPTVLLVAIVLLAVFKGSLPFNLTTFGILGMIVAMAAAIQLYAKKRRRDREKMEQASGQGEVLSGAQ
ncbi:protoporphyrinogen oxidase HemJ [Lusitaniella coriacea LEGE 07157]|uniref:Protoporphyrinogen IX oxidase n=1 Tax=Lusitaniella coriacea LEGE 07157 TaxID=945747 RepID=A0A8J7DWV4_9CYAN|nr:protoporphyrinogen oxidase HemJ [Lusitaniella coriacea]MBE9116722.1 protoporphyrinogen oxidase HemJ [Lusitaniella coriacea LEGE 07157]